jgi:carbamate kinase
VLVVAAVGRHALVRRDEPVDTEMQQRDAKAAAAALADVAHEHDLVVTHGDGPQAGLLARHSEARRDVRTYPLDVLGAGPAKTAGSRFEQELRDALPERSVVTLLTQVVVDPLDPAFRRPSAPVGPAYTMAEARDLATERGWSVAADATGGTWRRVVASPSPRSIVELPVIEALLAQGVLVVCAGGGGIPVVVDVHGARHGVEAVVDEDFAAARLARQLCADVLLLLTDVPCVELDHGTSRARPLRRVRPDELGPHEFAPESMRPKIEAACWFVSTTGNRAGIGALTDAPAIVRGEAGTIIEDPGEQR